MSVIAVRIGYLRGRPRLRFGRFPGGCRTPGLVSGFGTLVSEFALVSEFGTLVSEFALVSEFGTLVSELVSEFALVSESE
jgi:hypothetical protein